MTGVNEMNAIVRDRARIREGVVHLKDVQIDIHEQVWVRRADVLALLTDNVMESKTIPVKGV